MIPFYTNSSRSKQPILEAKCLSWTSGRYLPVRENFSIWDMYGTPAEINRKINVWFMFNVTKEDIKTYISLLKENLMEFHRKDQV